MKRASQASRSLMLAMAAAAGGLATFSAAGDLHAQETTLQDQPEILELDGIVVTARRRPERLQDVPLSVDVITNLELEESRSLDGFSALRELPGVSFGAVGDRSNSFLVIRGVGPLVNPLSPDDSSVLTFVNGAPLSVASSQLGYLDLERVEVLKGPQTTLFGRNTTGGAVNLVPVEPGPDYEGYFLGEYGTDDFHRVEAAATLPLIDDLLSTRFAVRRSGVDGFVTNLAGPDLGGEESWLGRASALLTPGDRFRLLVSAGGEIADNEPALGILRTDEDDDNTTAAQSLGYEDIGTWNVNAEASYEFDSFIVTSLTSYLDVDIETSWTLLDFLIGEALTDGALPPEAFSDQSTNFSRLRRDETRFSQELRLSSVADAEIGWTAGAVYYRDTAFNVRESNNFLFGPAVSGTDRYDLTTTGQAVFGEISYPIIEPLTVSIGARGTWEEKDFIGEYEEDGTAVGQVVPFFREESSETYDFWTGNIALSYEWTDTLTTYARVARGFKSGGFGVFSFLAPFGQAREPYESSTILSYELGGRGSFFGRRLDIDGAIFLNDVDSEQVSAFDPITFTNQNLNVDTLTAGFELESSFRLNDTWTLGGNLAFTHSELRNVTPEFAAAQPGSEDGNAVPNTPEWSAGASIAFDAFGSDLGMETIMADSLITGRLDYSYIGERFWDPGNFGRMPPVHLVSARLGVDLGFGEAYLFGDNILDDEFLTSNVPFNATPTSAPTVFAVTFDRGRVVGGGVSIRF